MSLDKIEGRDACPPEGGEAERDAGGRIVREAWVKWALTQPNPKPTWLVPYDELSEPDKEADRQIAEAVAAPRLAQRDALEADRNDWMEQAAVNATDLMAATARAEASEQKLAETEQAIRDASARLDTFDAPTHDEGEDGGPLSLDGRIDALTYRNALALEQRLSEALASELFWVELWIETTERADDAHAALSAALGEVERYLAAVEATIEAARGFTVQRDTAQALLRRVVGAVEPFAKSLGMVLFVNEPDETRISFRREPEAVERGMTLCPTVADFKSLAAIRTEALALLPSGSGEAAPMALPSAEWLRAKVETDPDCDTEAGNGDV